MFGKQLLVVLVRQAVHQTLQERQLQPVHLSKGRHQNRTQLFGISSQDNLKESNKHSNKKTEQYSSLIQKICSTTLFMTDSKQSILLHHPWLISKLYNITLGKLVGESAWLVIERLRVEIPAGAAGELSSQESALCADSYSVSFPSPCKTPQSFCQKCRWQVTLIHAYTRDPTKVEWADYAVVQALAGNLSGNEITHNSSRNTQS